MGEEQGPIQKRVSQQTTNALILLRLDNIILTLADIKTTVGDHEKRIRDNEIGLGKLLYVAGMSGGFGAALVAGVMSLAK